SSSGSQRTICGTTVSISRRRDKGTSPLRASASMASSLRRTRSGSAAALGCGAAISPNISSCAIAAVLVQFVAIVRRKAEIGKAEQGLFKDLIEQRLLRRLQQDRPSNHTRADREQPESIF